MAKTNVAEIHTDFERRIDDVDELSMLLAQLHAQLVVIHAGGVESFDECSTTIKDNYIWAMSLEAERAQELLQGLVKEGAL